MPPTARRSWWPIHVRRRSRTHGTTSSKPSACTDRKTDDRGLAADCRYPSSVVCRLSSGCGRRRQRQHRLKRLGIPRLPPLAGNVRVAEQPRDAGERFEMIGAGSFRREQHEQQIDRLTVQRLEVDRPVEPCEQAEQLVEPRELAVRNGDTVPDCGRAKLLALEQRLEDAALGLSGQLRGLRSKLLDRLLLAIDLQRRKDRVRRDEIVERHGTRSGDRQNLRSFWVKAADHKDRPPPRQWPPAAFMAGGSIQPIWPSG